MIQMHDTHLTPCEKKPVDAAAQASPTSGDGRHDFIAYVQLARIPGLGPKRLRDYLARMEGDPADVLEAFPHLALGHPTEPTLTRGQVEDEIAAHLRLNARLIGWGDPLYPNALKELADAPPLLSIRGDMRIWSSLLVPEPRTLGVVGARQGSINALRLTRLWSATAAKAGWIIVSGLAKGVDAAAHAGAISLNARASGGLPGGKEEWEAGFDFSSEDGGADPQAAHPYHSGGFLAEVDPSQVRGPVGATIAVSGCGVDVCYPEENRALFEQMAQEHIILSEHPLGQGPVAQHFPRRNRLIAVLSRGVLVVEAGLRSGSLITARCALEQNREVFVVPGFPLDPRYHGSNWLISEGAHLAQNMEEVLEQLMCLEHRAPTTSSLHRPRPPRNWAPLAPPPGSAPPLPKEPANKGSDARKNSKMPAGLGHDTPSGFQDVGDITPLTTHTEEGLEAVAQDTSLGAPNPGDITPLTTHAEEDVEAVTQDAPSGFQDVGDAHPLTAHIGQAPERAAQGPFSDAPTPMGAAEQGQDAWPETALLSLLSETPTSYEDLWDALEGGPKQALWTVAQLTAALQSLECQGRVQRHAGGTYSRLIAPT